MMTNLHLAPHKKLFAHPCLKVTEWTEIRLPQVTTTLQLSNCNTNLVVVSNCNMHMTNQSVLLPASLHFPLTSIHPPSPL